MNLAVYEWRKLFRLPALWAFLALCLAFNGLLIATLSPYDRAFFNETSQTAKALGQRVDEDFLAGLDAIPATENRDLLRQSVTGMDRGTLGFLCRCGGEIPSGSYLDDLEI